MIQNIIILLLSIPIFFINKKIVETYTEKKIKLEAFLSLLVLPLAAIASDNYMEMMLTFVFFEFLIIEGLIDYSTSYFIDWMIYAMCIIQAAYILSFKQDIKIHFFGLIVGAGVYLGIFLLSWFFYKRQAFGFGDVLMLGAIGFHFGPLKTILACFLPFYIALIFVLPKLFHNKDFRLKEIPFGPFICTSAIIIELLGDNIINWYLKLFW